MGHKQFDPATLAKIKSPAYSHLSNRELGARLGVSKSSVHKYRAAGSKPSRKVRRGRPLATSAQQRKALRAKVDRSGGSTRQLAEWCAQQGYPKISRGTVARVLKGGKHPREWRPVLSGRRLSDRNQQLRLQFARQHLHHNFKRVVFIDQKVLGLGYDESAGQTMRWQVKGSKKLFVKSTNPVMFVFYGAVAHGHKSKLVRVQLNQESNGRGCSAFGSRQFIEAFKELWEEMQGWYPDGQGFQVVMDNAKQHVSQWSKAKLAELGVPVMQGFLPQSYDMNLIEVVWGQLEYELVGSTHSKKGEYEQEIQQAWDRVEQDTIDKLVANHNKQLQKVIKQKGGWVGY